MALALRHTAYFQFVNTWIPLFFLTLYCINVHEKIILHLICIYIFHVIIIAILKLQKMRLHIRTAYRPKVRRFKHIKPEKQIQNESPNSFI